MSNPFSELPVDRKPTFYAVGVIGKVEAAKPSKKEDSPYWSVPITFRMLGTYNRPEERFWAVVQPAWLRPGFDAASLERRFEKELYRRVLASKKGETLVSAIVAEEGAFGFDPSAHEDTDDDTVMQAFADAIREGQGAQVGIVFVQEVENVPLDEVDENGKPKWDKVLKDRYQVGGFFTQAEVEGIERRVENDTQRRYRLGWELGSCPL